MWRTVCFHLLSVSDCVLSPVHVVDSAALQSCRAALSVSALWESVGGFSLKDEGLHQQGQGRELDLVCPPVTLPEDREG